MLEQIAIEQWALTFIGGFIFGTSVLYVRLYTMGNLSRVSYIEYVKYMLFAITAFYISFPFAQGFMWFWETGIWGRLVEVSVTYWTFMVLALVTGTVLNWVRTKR